MLQFIPWGQPATPAAVNATPPLSPLPLVYRGQTGLSTFASDPESSPAPALVGPPDAFLISRAGGELIPFPPLNNPLTRLPLIGSMLTWTTPALDTVSHWTDRLVNPVVSWSNRWSLKPIQVDPPRSVNGWQNAPTPDWRVGGAIIDQVAEAHGYRRGQPVRDSKIIRAMLEKAGQLYGVPGDYLARVADRESAGQHFDSSGRVKVAAAVGIMQIERSAFPGLMAGGAANALYNAYGLGNNIAIGAMQLRQYMDRQVREAGYRGSDPWHDLGPLLDIAYNAGSGALARAQQIARQRGLDPYNWQHLLLGRPLRVGLWGRLDVTPQDMANSPVAVSVQYFHNQYAAKGNPHHYPWQWHSPGMVKAFDFDHNGVATKTELLLSRILYISTGKRYRP